MAITFNFLYISEEILKGAYKKNGDRLLNRTYSNCSKLKESRFRLDIGNFYFVSTVRVMKH